MFRVLYAQELRLFFAGRRASFVFMMVLVLMQSATIIMVPDSFSAGLQGCRHDDDDDEDNADDDDDDDEMMFVICSGVIQ